MSEDIKRDSEELGAVAAEAESDIINTTIPDECEPLQVTLFDTDEALSENNVSDEVEPEEPEATAPDMPSPVHSEPVRERPEERRRFLDCAFDFLELFIFTLVAVLVVTTLFIRHSTVVGGSMENTLHDGETLLISNLFYTPERGDIIVVSDYSTSLKKPIIKRVIAVGGDTVRISASTIFVNGEALLEDRYVYTDVKNYKYSTFPESALINNEKIKINYKAGEYYEFTVPEGELFIMGDHRNDSVDSRSIGTVRVDAVLGRVILRILPFARFGLVD
ncbi:MAG: signal peptidase I [Clostridia bacterium]|nr:signal peptidase I [Clostridia bacterium]